MALVIPSYMLNSSLNGEFKMNKKMWILGNLIIFIFLISCAATPVIPITEINAHELIGKWEGTRIGRRGGDVAGMADVTMEVFSVSPVRAKLLFHGTRNKGTITYGLIGKIENGYIVGELKGFRNPTVKLGLHKNEDGRLELRGDYRSRGTVAYEGDLTLKKI